MMTGVYATNPTLRDKARDDRAARLEAKRAELAARLAALGGKR